MMGDQDPDDERRSHRRYAAAMEVDVRSEEHFLFAYIENISEMGLFIRTDEPVSVGTELELKFQFREEGTVALPGEVVWVNPVRPEGDNLNPGMGVRFLDLQPAQREQLVQLVRTIAYLSSAETAD
ncbi:MAG: TIGR02266 family protein [Myxococcota bacterium]